MSNSSQLFSYTVVSSSFELIHPLFLSYRAQTDRQTYAQEHAGGHTHTDGHEYSIVVVDKPQLLPGPESPYEWLNFT